MLLRNNLPKLEKLKLTLYIPITGGFFKYFNLLKALDLDLREITNENLAVIAENCLELQALTITGKFLFDSILYPK